MRGELVCARAELHSVQKVQKVTSPFTGVRERERINNCVYIWFLFFVTSFSLTLCAGPFGCFTVACCLPHTHIHTTQTEFT